MLTWELCFILWTNLGRNDPYTHSQSCCIPVKLCPVKGTFSYHLFMFSFLSAMYRSAHSRVIETAYHPTLVRYYICTKKCTICIRSAASQIHLFLNLKIILNSFCNVSGILPKRVWRCSADWLRVCLFLFSFLWGIFLLLAFGKPYVCQTSLVVVEPRGLFKVPRPAVFLSFIKLTPRHPPPLIPSSPYGKRFREK